MPFACGIDGSGGVGVTETDHECNNQTELNQHIPFGLHCYVVEGWSTTYAQLSDSHVSVNVALAMLICPAES